MPAKASNAEQDSEQVRLQAAERAYAMGDYRALQRELQAVQSVKTESGVNRVQALRRAISVDPGHLALLLACLLALVVIAALQQPHESDLEQGTQSR